MNSQHAGWTRWVSSFAARGLSLTVLGDFMSLDRAVSARRGSEPALIKRKARLRPHHASLTPPVLLLALPSPMLFRLVVADRSDTQPRCRRRPLPPNIGLYLTGVSI